jgi:hypothetical protein
VQSTVSAANFYWEYAILILWADRGNKVCVQLHLTIWKELWAKLGNVLWYVPKLVEKSHEGEVTILWLQQMQTDRTISNNKLGIIIQLIDTAISEDQIVIKKEAEKILHYKDLTIEV